MTFPSLTAVLSVCCDSRGSILRVIRDDLQLMHTQPGSKKFTDLVCPTDVKVADRFLNALRKNGSVGRWVLAVSHNGEPRPFTFAGGSLEGTLFIIGLGTHADAKVRAGSEMPFYEELSRLNNELMTTQRELTKKNVELSRVVSRLEKARIELQKSRDTLDEKVRQRTAELLRANDALRGEIAERERTERQLLDSQSQLRALAARLQLIREEERTRIAREVHDDLGQSLTALKMDLAWIKKQSPKGLKPLLTKAESMSTLVDETTKAVRKIATELRPGILDNLGLVAAIEWQAQEFQRKTNVKCRFSSGSEEIAAEPQICTALFRILQETLTNVARHAGANTVTIKLEENAGELTLRVRDDGRGISKQELANPHSLGLLGMRERMIPLGGRLDVSAGKPKGTLVTVRVPWNKGGKRR